MYLTAITHASARDKDHHFRGLTPAGQEESAGAAQHYEALTNGEGVPAFDQIVSSPKPRCLETVILFAKAVGNDSIKASSVAVDANLAAGEIEGGELATLAAAHDAAHDAEGGAEHVLVSGHADMVKTLPPGTSLTADAADGGWFSVRPVLFQVEVKSGQSWDKATVHFCRALVNGQWHDLLA